MAAIINNYDNINDNNVSNAIQIYKFSYNCYSGDAVWTGSSRGVGVLIFNQENKIVRFNKLSGCNPYWWQVSAAAISLIDPDNYVRSRDRWRPFKVNIREGMSGCVYLHLNNYYKTKEGLYILDGKGKSFNISATEKVQDGVSLEFGDLIEFSRALCQYFDMPFNRNPRWWKRGSSTHRVWRAEKLRSFEVVNEVDYDPDNK